MKGVRPSTMTGLGLHLLTESPGVGAMVARVSPTGTPKTRLRCANTVQLFLSDLYLHITRVRVPCSSINFSFSNLVGRSSSLR